MGIECRFRGSTVDGVIISLYSRIEFSNFHNICKTSTHENLFTYLTWKYTELHWTNSKGMSVNKFYCIYLSVHSPSLFLHFSFCVCLRLRAVRRVQTSYTCIPLLDLSSQTRPISTPTISTDLWTLQGQMYQLNSQSGHTILSLMISCVCDFILNSSRRDFF